MKRLLIILCLTVLLVVLAVPALAADGDTHSHCLCCNGRLTEGCDHTDVKEFTEVTTYEELQGVIDAAQDGGTVSVYVGAEFAASSSNITIDKNKTVNLCLNDKTIILGKKFVVNGNGTLNITACGGGQIKAKEGNTAGQLLIAGNNTTGHISMYDGTVDAGNVNGTGQAGAVYLNASKSSFTLYGGTIVGAGKIKRGGGVYVNNASAVFYMYGGEITGGHATEYGGAINVATGSVEMSGGIITGCSADINGGGVSLLISATSFTLSGDANIYGNTADDVYIGNSNKTDTYFLTLGRWEGNDKDENGNARTLKLVHKEEAADRKVIGYAEGVTNPAAMRSYFAVSDGYQLMADAEKMTLQDSTAHIHCICNGNAVGKNGHTCEDLIWTAATQASFAPDTEEQADDTKLFYDYSDGYRLKANSNIYLTEAVSLTTEKYRTNGKTLNLCLCDQTVTVGSDSNLHVSRDNSANNNFGYLNITDHSNGQILADGCSTGFLYIERGHLSMYGGKVDANNKGINVVSMNTSGTFALYSGTVTGGSSAAGGNVQVRSGCTFTMYGGNIENGTATTTKTASGTGGGNVYVADGGTFYMHGGTISGGQCSSSFGGNVCVLGSMDMTGGTISGGSAKAGGNVAVSSDNTANVGGAMTMSAGLITGGTATGRGNGVYLRNMSNDLTLSGSAKIYGNNTDTGDKTDVSIAKALTDGSYRAIQLDGWNGNGKNENGQANPKLVADREGDFAQRFAVFAEGAEIDGHAATYFASKTSGYYVLLNEDDQLIFVNTPGNVTLRSGSAVLASFSKLQDAVIAAQGSNDIVVLNQPLTEDVTVSGNVYVDLNGFDVTGKMTVGQGRLYLIDRATADYTVETDEEGNVTGGYGKITGGVTGDYAVTFNTPKATYGNNWKYLVLADEDGAVHAHRIYLTVSDAVLYPQTASLKYKTVFYADEVAAGAIGDYGIILSETNEVSASFGAPLAYAGENNNSKLTLLSKVLETDMELLEQIERSGKQITARAYIKLNGVQDNVLESSPKTVSFESVVTTVLHWTEEEAKDMTIAQKMAMVDMHNSYNDLIHSWCGDTEEVAQSVQIHCDWMANIRCVCLGQNEGHEGHLTCEYSYYEAVSTAEEFAAYFTDNVLDRDASLRLTGDFTLSSAFNLGGHTLNLWLNGHTLTMTGTARLTANANGELNITDSGENGKILAAEGCRETLVNTNNGILNLYGGVIDASAIRLGTGGSTVGAAVSMGQEVDQFHMYGGKLVGGQVSRGGTLYVYKGSAKIYGGEITGGEAANGGNISVNFGSLELYGGKIYGGTATSGAGVHIGANAKNKTLLISGDAMIYGNGTEDVYLGSATGSDNYLTLDGWNGNGENAALKLNCRAAGIGSVVAVAKEGALTADDRAKLSYTGGTYALELNAEGKIVLSDGHTHCLCNGTQADAEGHTCTELTFTEVASADEFKALFNAENKLEAAANVVLTADITLDASYESNGYTWNLCLNGYGITLENGGKLSDDCKVLDCTRSGGVTTNVDLVMFMGQSNMAGRGVASQSEVVPAGQGYEFRAISDPTKLYPIAEPFGVNENNSASGVTETTKTGSMVSSFVKAYYEEMQVPVVAVSCSKGSTGLDFWQVNGNALNDAIARHEAAKNWLHANAYTVGNDFMVWCQGETDGGKGMSAADYSNGLKGIIEEMVTETGIDFCAVVRIGNARNNAARHAQIIKAQTQLCKSFDKAVLVSAKLAGFGADMMKDDYHYTQPAYNEVGKDAGTNAAAYVKTGIEPAMYDPQYKNNYPADDIPEGTAVTSLEFTFDSATENGVQLTDIGTVADGALKVTDATNGSKNGILLPADKQFTISPDKSFTIEFVTTGTEGVILLGSGSSTGGFVYFSPASSPKVRLRFDSSLKQFEAITQAVSATAKTHIAIVYDADTKTLSMYQDGKALTVKGNMSNFGTITFTTLCGGYMNTTNNYYYRGDLHYFRYVEQALTVDQFHQEP